MDCDGLDQIAAAARSAGERLAAFTPRMEVMADGALDIANMQSRTRFRRCSGCDDCTEPLPVLAGDV